MYKVSVIIPVYGVEKYIERCARSLFEQTIDDIEYIFVDDCTKDSSIEVLNKVIEDYPHRKDSVVIVHHEVNKGLPAARQTGIKFAKGEYIAHCDSDDWVSTEMYYMMYERALSDGADMVLCDFIKTDGKEGQRYNGSQDGPLMLIPEMLTRKSSPAVWNKIVKRQLYTDYPIVYPQENMGEDFNLIIQLVYYSKGRISYLQEPLYYYFVNANSITRDPSEASIVNKFNQGVSNVVAIEKFLKEKGITERYKDEWMYYKHTQRNVIDSLITNPKYYKIWRNTFPEINKKMLVSPFLSLHKRVNLLLTYLGVRIGL